MTDLPSEHALRVFVYEVKLCQEDGTRGSGWSMIVVTDSLDPADLLRVARIEAERLLGSAETWVGIDSAVLLHAAVLDPRVAA